VQLFVPLFLERNVDRCGAAQNTEYATTDLSCRCPAIIANRMRVAGAIFYALNEAVKFGIGSKENLRFRAV
jgi:hypothetical protein